MWIQQQFANQFHLSKIHPKSKSFNFSVLLWVTKSLKSMKKTAIKSKLNDFMTLTALISPYRLHSLSVNHLSSTAASLALWGDKGKSLCPWASSDSLGWWDPELQQLLTQPHSTYQCPNKRTLVWHHGDWLKFIHPSIYPFIQWSFKNGNHKIILFY